MTIISETQIKENLQKVLETVAGVEVPVALATLAAALVVVVLGGVNDKSAAVSILDDVLTRAKADLENNWDRRWVLEEESSKQ